MYKDKKARFLILYRIIIKAFQAKLEIYTYLRNLSPDTSAEYSFEDTKSV